MSKFQFSESAGGRPLYRAMLAAKRSGVFSVAHRSVWRFKAACSACPCPFRYPSFRGRQCIVLSADRRAWGFSGNFGLGGVSETTSGTSIVAGGPALASEIVLLHLAGSLSGVSEVSSMAHFGARPPPAPLLPSLADSCASGLLDGVPRRSFPPNTNR